MDRINKFIKFLKIINSGQELIDINDNKILVGYVDDIPKIGIKYIKFNTKDNSETEVILEPPIFQDLNNFIEYIDNYLCDDELNTGLMNITLNKKK